jgi:hypothetical protein
MYQSGTTVGAGFGQHQVESEWESLRVASREFRAAQADTSNVSVGLMFHDVVPARKERHAFMQEIAGFIRSRANTITADSTAFWPHEFTSPLMTKYLCTLHLRARPQIIESSFDRVRYGFTAVCPYHILWW